MKPALHPSVRPAAGACDGTTPRVTHRARGREPRNPQTEAESHPAPVPVPEPTAAPPLPLQAGAFGRLSVALAFACALNLAPLEIVGGAQFLLGPFIAWTFVLRLPAIPAILVAALPAAIITTGIHGTLLLPLSLAEAVWFVVARDRWRRHHPVLVDALFWGIAGAPLVYLYCAHILRWPAEFTALEIITRVINQFAAVIVAHFLHRESNFGRRLWAARGGASNLRGLVFDYVFVLAAVPLALVALGFSELLRERAHDEGERLVAGTAQRVAGELRSFLTLHRAAIASAAELLDRGTDPDHVLQATHRQHPAFVTMLTADATGRLQHAAPHEAEPRLAGLFLGDREYFKGSRNLMRPFVSGVFRGRGFGRDVLVGISAPVRNAQGSFQGIVQGSVLVSRFREFSAQPGGVEVIIVDPRSRVVHASPAAGLDSLETLRSHPLASLLDQGPTGAPFSYDHESGGRATRRMLAYSAPCTDFPFVVIAQLPQIAILNGVKEFYLLMGVIAAGVLATAASVTRFARRQLSSPLEAFASGIAEQAAAGVVGPMPVPGRGAPQEITLVFQAFNHLASRLQASYDELRETNAALDARVADRTRALEIARHQAEAASQSKTDFLAMTSHEIRTPLNAVIGLAESLIDAAQPGPTRERLHTIRDSARSLVSVVNDLLDISRIETGQLELRIETVDPRKVCQEIFLLFRDRARASGLDLRLALQEGDAVWVATDPQRLRQVLINLVGNALKFTAAGSVDLRFDVQPAGPSEVAVRFSVVDTGPGIPASEQARLFEPYFRASTGDLAPGTGLGLAISRRLVELLGGRVQLRSAVGAGSEFVCAFRWPLATPPRPAPPSADPEPSANTSGLRILAVDDNPANQEVLRALLETRCASLTLLSRGQDALEQLGREPFDLAFIDLEMPDLDGFTLARKVRSPTAASGSHGFRLVAASAYPRDQMLADCQAAGFDDYLEKPIDRQHLLGILKEAARAAR